MARAWELLVLLVLIFSLMLPSQAAPAAGPGANLALHVVPLAASVREGGRAGVFVRAGAGASLTLTVRYAATIIGTYHGTADATGRYVFTWAVPAHMSLSGRASLRVEARRGPQMAWWAGTLTVVPSALPILFVQASQPRLLAGAPLGFFVHTEPGVAFTYIVIADNGDAVGAGTGQADGAGRAVVTVPEPLLPRAALGVTVRVMVSTENGTRTREARLTLLPRPPLPLFVATSSKTVRAGDPLGVFISTSPGAAISLSISVTTTVVLTGTGTADALGRWVYSAPLLVVLKHQHAGSVSVRVSKGLDDASVATGFVLRPGPVGLTQFGFDRLATAANPAPDLHRYFTVMPEKLVAISTEGQVLREYEHGLLVHENYVTTGRPELPTVHGIFQVYLKQSPFTFVSPWPMGSQFYYPPSPVQYWMPFIGGYGLHDSPWRSVYGPGTNLPHYSSDPGEPVGSHGCVNIPLVDMVWLWNWASVGTTVLVY